MAAQMILTSASWSSLVGSFLLSLPKCARSFTGRSSASIASLKPRQFGRFSIKARRSSAISVEESTQRLPRIMADLHRLALLGVGQVGADNQNVTLFGTYADAPQVVVSDVKPRVPFTSLIAVSLSGLRGLASSRIGAPCHVNLAAARPRADLPVAWAVPSRRAAVSAAVR